MFIKNAIVASSLVVAILGLNSTARATSDTNLDVSTEDFSSNEELNTPIRRRSLKFQTSPRRQDPLFSQPFYEGSPEPIRRFTLEPGNRGSQVTGLQQRLQVHGFNPGRIDSVFGSRTERAVRAFQKARGLDANGIVDRRTWRFLEADPKPVVIEEVLTKGTKGSKIITLQTRLQVKGYNPGPIDGVFGGRTQAAVIAYQKAKNLKVSGVVDEMTWKALSQELY
ncbi:MAG: peptidoglycan-binding protein [Cyanobacteria bacterium J06592_8]